MFARRNEAGNVRDIHHQQRAYLVRHLTELFKIELARIGACARDDHFWLMLQRQLTHGFIINLLCFLIHAVRNDIEVFARDINRAAVREMPAVREAHAEYRVARFEHRKIYRRIRLRARMRLNIRKLRTKQLLCALNRERFGHVNKLTAAVIPLARIPFGILVGQMRPHRVHHGFRHEVFGSDELNVVLLTVQLIHHGFVDFFVCRLHFGIIKH